GDRHIDTSKAGTDHQDALVLCDIAQRASGPGIRNITLAMRRSPRKPRIARRKVAERDHHSVGEYYAATAKTDLRGVANRNQGNRFILHMFELAGVTFDLA